MKSVCNASGIRCLSVTIYTENQPFSVTFFFPPTISSNYFKKLNHASPLILVTLTFVLSPGKLSYRVSLSMALSNGLLTQLGSG